MSGDVENLSVPVQYNDSCYGSVTVKINTLSCLVAAKSKVNEGDCADE